MARSTTYLNMSLGWTQLHVTLQYVATQALPHVRNLLHFKKNTWTHRWVQMNLCLPPRHQHVCWNFGLGSLPCSTLMGRSSPLTGTQILPTRIVLRHLLTRRNISTVFSTIPAHPRAQLLRALRSSLRLPLPCTLESP